MGREDGFSPQMAPTPASITLLGALRAMVRPKRFPKPPQCGPYSCGSLVQVVTPELINTPARGSGPTVRSATHLSRCFAVRFAADWPRALDWKKPIRRKPT